MRAFARLFAELDRTTRTTEKVAALERYFRSAPGADAAWALWFLAGRRFPRAVKTTHLRQWAAETAGLPLWLVEECYAHVGDLAETVALLLPENPHATPPPLAELVAQRLEPLVGATEAMQRSLLHAAWAELDTPQRFLWHKLITGNFRVGVARALLVRALAGVAGVEPAVMAHRLMGEWRPTAGDFARLIAGQAAGGECARPYPFYLASPLEGEPGDLGEVAAWQLEWKWDGIRGQLLCRTGQVVLWSRGEELITAGFPEIAEAAGALPDGTVLDGEVLAWRGDGPLPFAQLQRRLTRREPSGALRRDVPVVFVAYDLLEVDGRDIRDWPLERRRHALEQVLAQARPRLLESRAVADRDRWVQAELFPTPALTLPPIALRVSPVLPVRSWNEAAALRQQARAAGAEGLMLKRRDAVYGTGRQRGAWWKWKVDPFTCDAVLVAAQPGHGRRATLFTDYTFAVWQGPELVPVAKAYSGLTDAEIDAVDAFVRANTTARYGPVRAVRAALVFELAFDGIARSPRHQARLALRFPRIARWRRDKAPAEADSIESLERLVAATASA